MFLIPILQSSKQSSGKNFFRISIVTLTMAAIFYALVLSSWDIVHMFLPKAAPPPT